MIEPIDILKPVRRRVAVAWVSWGLSLALLWGEHQLRVLHPHVVPLLILVVLTFVAALGALFRGLWRLLRGPRRASPLAWALAAVLPALFWAVLCWYGSSTFGRREVPHNLPMALLRMAAASLMEGQAHIFYPHRLESERLVMYYDDGVVDPADDIEKMDRHVAAMEELTGLRLRTKVYFVRGKLLGQGTFAYLGLALGSAEGAAGTLDRHELAHAILNQHETPDTDVPALLSEGWAESQSKDSKALAEEALSQRRFDLTWAKMSEPLKREFAPTLWDAEGMELLAAAFSQQQGKAAYLRELTSPSWYHRHKGAVYLVGGAFVDFLLRKYGAGRFVDLYFACRPGAFERECLRIYGTNLETLEAEFWQDAERIVSKF